MTNDDQRSARSVIMQRQKDASKWSDYHVDKLRVG